MKQELDKALVQDFPNLYRNRHAPMMQTAMCWGFECGDGWEPLIRRLSEKLEPIIISKTEDITTEKLIEFRKMKKWIFKDHKIVYLNELEYTEESLEEHLQKFPHIRHDSTWNEKDKSYIMYSNPRWNICASQVKEKYGTLRFYMTGYLQGMDRFITQAEKESAKICELCGKSGKLYTSGWYMVRCKQCLDENEIGVVY